MSDDELMECLKHFQLRSIRKKEVFLKEGEISRERGLVNKGCFRRFTTNANGKEVILNFASEDWWIGNLESMSNQQPTIYTIQALEEGEVFCIPQEDHLKLCDRMPKYHSMHEEKAKKSLYASLKKLTIAKAGSHEDKYQALVSQQPELFQRVPMHYIASYLGIEPESLSRLRKRLVVKEKSLNHRQ